MYFPYAQHDIAFYKFCMLMDLVAYIFIEGSNYQMSQKRKIFLAHFYKI
jgi:hypothetical protein